MNTSAVAFKHSVLAGICLLAGCEKSRIQDISDEASRASHQRMVLVLKQIEVESRRANPFLSDSELLRLTKLLEELPPNVPGSTRGVLLHQLGWQELLQGKEKESISHLEEALGLMSASSSDPTNIEMLKGTLATAYLRLAEAENCCARPGPESCIFPLRGDAIHELRLGSEKAFPLFVDIGKNTENRLYQGEAAWLANVALMTLGKNANQLPDSMRIPAEIIAPKPGGFPEFRNIAQKAGVDTFGLSGGAVMDDFDGDGFYDLVVSQWNSEKSALYFRNKGDGTFENLSEEANLRGIKGGLNIVQADYDNDGDLDVLILRGAWLQEFGRHPNSLLRNDGVNPKTGAVVFTDVTFSVGLAVDNCPTQTASWADFDLDGDLDLFVGNESTGDLQFPCQLFRNEGNDHNGKVRFVEIAKEAGVDMTGFVKGVIWGDYDGDRYPDLYVSSISTKNQLFRNRGDGTFENVSAEKKVGDPIRSFPAWFWDFNNDGFLDIFASSYTGIPTEIFRYFEGEPTPEISLARLYQNNGAGEFTEVGRQVGLDMPMLPMGSNFGDLMNDGFPDMYLGTGNPLYTSIVPNIFLSNEHGVFVDRTVSSRLGHLQKGHAVAMGDFDRDGDLDIFEQMGGAYRGDPAYDALFENPGNLNRWLSIRLKGKTSNSFGVGSRVRVVVLENGVERSIYQWMNSGGTFGGNPLELHFGLADAKTIARVEVLWPMTGKTQILKKVKPNQRIEIVEK